jgi:hypothetical protein
MIVPLDWPVKRPGGRQFCWPGSSCSKRAGDSQCRGCGRLRPARTPVAEHVAKTFWAAIHRKSSVRLPAARLTQNHRRFSRVSLMQTPPSIPEIPSLCRQCGKPIKQTHKYCQGCSTEVSKGHLIKSAQLGRIAAQTPEVRSRRGQKQSLHRRAELTWDPKSQPNWLTESFYIKKIQPRLAELTVSSIALALNISIPYASELRAGRDRPHPRHWLTLAQLLKLDRGQQN